MISNLNQASEGFLSNIARVQRTVDEASRQVSSGKRVNVASDDPGNIDTIMQLQTADTHNQQIQANLAVVATDANAADTALTSATKLMDRARTLATQASSFTMDASGRQGIAAEVQSLLEQMVTISRTTVQGRYVFGGDQDATPPYDLDLTAVNGAARLTNTAATRRVEDASGGSFAVSLGAQQIFDVRDSDDNPASGNVFASLNSLRNGLLANDIPQITAANSAIQVASDHLNVSQAFYGTVQNRIQDAANYADGYSARLKIELGQKQDADITAAALAITQGNTELQAAFAMQAKMPRTTLFDFMV
jgi:flagellar hook-associated protein 3 FlgL